MRAQPKSLSTALIDFLLNCWNTLPISGRILVILIALVLAIAAIGTLIEWLRGPVTERFVEGVRVVSYKKLAKLTRCRDKNRRHLQIMMGQVPWPADFENEHALIVGATGVGKSTLIRQLLPRIRARAGRAIVIDLNGEFASQFLMAGDKVFCPFDKRTVKWNPLAEVRTTEDIDIVLKAAIPMGTNDEDENWRGYARKFLRALMLRLHEAGELRMERLRHYVMDSGDKELAAFLQEGANPYRLQTNNMASTVKTLAQSCIQSLDHGASDSDFSIRQWVRNGKGFIFITPKDRDRAALSNLISAFMNLAITESLSPPDGKRFRPISIVVDELSSFDFDDLKGVLEKGRKFGLVAFAGIQNTAQLQEKYGQYGASTLMSCFLTKIIFNPGDPDTADRMAEVIGRHVVERLEVSHTKSSGHYSTTRSWRRELPQPVVLRDTLRKLPKLTAYLKFEGNYPVAKITIPRS